MPQKRSKMVDKPESDTDDQEQIPLTSWLNLYRGFISDTADILTREIDTIRNVKISKNEAILKKEKTPETVRLMKNIVTSFHDSIGKAVKDLQAHGAQMSEDLQKRFNLPEDWLQSTSTNVSVAGSVINGSNSRNRKEMENRLEFLLGDSRKDDEEYNLGNDNNNLPSTSSADEGDIVNFLSPPSASPTHEDLDETIKDTDDPAAPSQNVSTTTEVLQEEEKVSENKNEEELVTRNDKEEGTSKKSPRKSSKKSKEELEAMRDPVASSDSDIELFETSSNEEVVRSPDPATPAAPSQSTPTKTEVLQEEEKVSANKNEEELVTHNDKEEGTNMKSPRKPNKKSKEELEATRDLLAYSDSETVLTESSSKKVIKSSPDPAAPSAPIQNTPIKTEVLQKEEKVSENKNEEDLATCSIKEEGASKKNTTGKSNKSKEELEAMRDLLASSGSDTEPTPKKRTKSPRKQEPKIKTEGSKDKESSKPVAKQSWRDDPKLKEGAAKVRLERLSAAIEKSLAEEKYVVLKGYTKMKRCSLDALAKSNESDSSESSSASNDSLHELERQLKKLSRNSIIRTKKYEKTKKETEKVLRKKTRKDRRSARGVEDEFLSTDSDDSVDIKSSKLKISPNLLSNDIVSCSGSEDIDMDSDGSTTKKKQPARSNPARNTDKKRKVYLQPTISDSDSEKRNMKEILGSDSDSDSTKKRTSRAKKSKVSSGSDSDFITTKKNASKKKAKGSDSDQSLIIIKTESDDSDTDSDFVTKKSSKRRRDSSTESKKRKKKRRKRIVTNDSDDSGKKTSNDSDIEEIPQDDEPSSSQKGRKKIRKIMSNKELAKTTKEAEKEEEERRRRLADKQKLFNGIHKAPESDKLERLVLDVDPETKEPVIEVDQSIVRKLKPHQAEGIKFMYNACFESVDMIKQGKIPGGCILAHCMGLGKTLQSIAFIHTLLTNKVCGIKTALVICPLSTVNNWFNEFRSWTDDAEQLKLHKLYEAKNTVSSRIDYLKTWHRRGGVGILHYDMFRRLADPKGKAKMKQSFKDVIRETLLDPGPDIVICDEGHLLKNCKSMLSLAVSNIRTHRRIVLTGTPLQNNLVEYHTMMNFVKPNLLGSLPEFTNRFVNPIKNGQHADSTEYDVKTMKRRAHVLHRKLEGCVQRCDYSILSPYLPPKYEYIIKIKLSEKQEQLYKYYLSNVIDPDPLARRRHLLKYYAELVKVWTHPIALTMRRTNKDDDEESTSDGGSIKDFIDDDESTSPSSASGDEGSSDSQKKGGKNSKRRTRAQAANDPDAEKEVVPNLDDVVQRDWWSTVFKSKSEMEDCNLSGKLVILQEILKTSEAIGDKVLVFSQYLSSLDIIEEFLQNWDIDAEKQEKEKDEPITFPLPTTPQPGRWRRNIEYFRIDGQTKVQDRHRDCEKFNKKSSLSKAKLFLISTRAGGLGINLYGANRVVIFDASWNPSQDMQSIFRVYRFGQDKPCYIYRLIAQGTMEEKILRRQITKLSLSSRVVDEHQIERHFKFDDVNEMYMYDEEDPNTKDAVLAVPKDRLLADLVMSHREWIRGYEEFDSLLENKPDEGLTNEEKELAWEEYRIESERQRQFTSNSSSAANEAATFLKVKSRLVANHPSATPNQIDRATKVSMDVIEKIRRLMLLQNNGGDFEHLLNPLKRWLQTAVSPHPPAPPVPNEGQILEDLPQAYYESMIPQPMVYNQYAPRPPIIRRHPQFNAPMQPAPQLIQHMSHNFRHIASSTLGSGINRTYQQQQ